MSGPTILLIEPYYGGSHKQFLDNILQDYDNTKYVLFTMPAKKWHWRARTSALYFSQVIPKNNSFKVIFCSSVLNLSEFLGLRPDLQLCRKIIYFHENQLVYPVEHKRERDFQYGYNEILSCIVADQVVFNSQFNKQSFIGNIEKHLNMQPDFRIHNIEDIISIKCEVKYFPIAFNSVPEWKCVTKSSSPVHIVWPHRWEHDKNPELFFDTLFNLKDNNIPFKLSLLGEHTADTPAIFDTGIHILKDCLVQHGYVDNKEEYYRILQSADIIVSTSKHEFFGVAMLEGTYCGCLPLVPNILVYPEIYPKECLYNTSNQLYKILARWCKHPDLMHKIKKRVLDNFPFHKYDAKTLVQEFHMMIDDVL